MTRYQLHMQLIHNQATALSIEMAVTVFTEDVLEYLIKSGVKADSKIIQDLRNLSKYEYNAKTSRC